MTVGLSPQPEQGVIIWPPEADRIVAGDYTDTELFGALSVDLIGTRPQLAERRVAIEHMLARVLELPAVGDGEMVYELGSRLTERTTRFTANAPLDAEDSVETRNPYFAEDNVRDYELAGFVSRALARQDPDSGSYTATISVLEDLLQRRAPEDLATFDVASRPDAPLSDALVRELGLRMTMRATAPSSAEVA